VGSSRALFLVELRARYANLRLFVCRKPDVALQRITENDMPARREQKKVLKSKAKRVSVNCQKEAWYAGAAARFSAARPSHKSH
jgi:hypothetical protein